MNIAVACCGLDVAPYFSQSASYTCYQVDRGIITGSRNLPATDMPLDGLVDLLHKINVDTLIVGRIEYDRANYLCHSGIEVVAGAQGSAIDVVKAYVSKTLSGVIEPCKVDLSPTGKKASVSLKTSVSVE
jgi:predicted Fe-Mo cluster-binding NifX family protein